jgi:hypothetical protein
MRDFFQIKDAAPAQEEEKENEKGEAGDRAERENSDPALEALQKNIERAVSVLDSDLVDQLDDARDANQGERNTNPEEGDDFPP